MATCLVGVAAGRWQIFFAINEGQQFFALKVAKVVFNFTNYINQQLDSFGQSVLIVTYFEMSHHEYTQVLMVSAHKSMLWSYFISIIKLSSSCQGYLKL